MGPPVSGRDGGAEMAGVDGRAARDFHYGLQRIQHVDDAACFTRMREVDLDIGQGLRLGNGRQQCIAINLQRPLPVAGF